ncbi:hypothetical protein [Dyella nitratireducens]|uniref:Uncharacterized protein n=1 Tax=Dyella nitratireducens TaxID=1849580 RepID=A0ABQ1FXT9_9GAMM|nr:hypothetical protein [Dyella nitratireducens]GGA32564.1 hypothetical protein GCM10010981_22110 [Dyella nitratireducens]GLQ42726.1 hypothetical protein GCM10007902_25760 [Dyella nitratireducens]
MRGWRLIALTLACAISATAVAAKQPAPNAANATPAPPREKALLGFQNDLINVLAPSGDPERLLAAALLARPLPNPSKLNSFHSLIERAARVDGAGPAVSWARLADCDPNAHACPNSDAVAQLVQQAPDNAAVWLVKLSLDTNNLKNDDARQDLAKAASAKLYDDYSGVALKDLANAATLLPPPSATLDPNSNAGANGVQVLIAFGSAAGMPQPALRDTASFCEGKAPKDDSIKSDCLKLGQLLEWGSSPLARSLGLHLRQVLNADPAQQQDAQNARRNLIWQVQNFAAVSFRAQNDKAQAQHLLALARSGGTQMSLVLAALHDAGVATDAPTDWQPSK